MRERITLGRMQNPVRGFLHGAAAVVSVIGGILLVVRAGNVTTRVALSVFAIGLVGLYTTSSLYHSIPWRRVWKARMQRLDHSMIFMLVAGTFTPFVVMTFSGMARWVFITVVWTIAGIGILQLVFIPRWSRGVSISLQTTLGWLGLLVVIPLARIFGWWAVAVLGLGGAFYTIGMIIMLTGRPRLWPRVFSSHELFHVFVVAASASHYFVVYRWLAPAAA